MTDHTGWDRLKLSNGWIAIWAGAVVMWATGFVVTGDVFWALDLADVLWGKVRDAITRG